MIPKFKYENYQAVRHNLTVYFVGCLWAAAGIFYFVVLSGNDRDSVEGWFASLDDLHGPFQVGLFGSVLIGFAVLVVEILGFHDRFYDRLIIRWREEYDKGFIIPRLLRPFNDLCSSAFHEWATQNSKDTLKELFYPFVTDRETKISSNTLVRFYEAITRYWLSQLIELTSLLFIVATVAYRVVGNVSDADSGRLFLVMATLVALIIVNRGFIRMSLNDVRSKTNDEIDEILSNHKADLRKRVEQLSRDRGFAS